MAREIIIALDLDTKEEVFALLDKIGEPCFCKVGMQLYYSEGASLLKELKDKGHKVFLDLKLHDIPNTVSQAMQVLAKYDIDMVNVHAAGGVEMMRVAKEAFKGKDTIVIAVTQLTSTSQEVLEKELLIEKPMEEVVLQYAKNTKDAGMDGVVCSPLEAKLIHDKLGYDFKTICPGIRPSAKQSDDQVRITTPSMAKDLTCDYIVVGRPITKADNPKEIYQQIKKDFEV